MRRFARATYHAGVILLFILIAVAGFTQTRFFKSSLRDFILREAATGLGGELTLGQIDGNLLTGFVISDIGLRLDSVDVVRAERIELRYDPIGIPFARVALSRAVLVRPTIRIWRGLDGQWNFDRLVSPTPEDTVPGSWTYDLRNIELRDATVEFRDSLRMQERTLNGLPPPADSVVDYARLDLHHLQLLASAQIARGNLFVQLGNLAFTSESPDFHLKKLRADIALTKTEAAVRSFSLESAGSRLRLNASLRGIDVASITSVQELEKVPVILDLNSPRLDTRELAQFLSPWVDFLHGTYVVRMKAGGTFGALTVDQLFVQAGETILETSGVIQHLDGSKPLVLDIQGERNRVDTRGIDGYLPGLDLPDLSMLGDITFGFQFSGQPTDFEAVVTSDCAAGGVDADASVRIEDSTLVYKASGRLRDGDAAIVTGSERHASQLNGTFEIDGRGTSIHEMLSVARVEFDSSVALGLPLQRSVIVADVADRVLRTHGQVRLGEMSLNADATLTFGPASALAYAVDARVNSLDLAAILNRETLRSELSFSAHAEGRSTRTGSQDSIDLVLHPSIMGDEALRGHTLSIRYVDAATDRAELMLRSDFCDLDVEGSFDLASLVASVEQSVRMTTGVIRSYVNDLDSLQATHRDDPDARAALTPMPLPAADFRFKLNGKEMFPLGVLLFEPFEGSVSVEGSVKTLGDTLRFDATAAATQFAWAFPKDTLTLLETNARIALEGLSGSSELPTGQLRWDGRGLSLRSVAFIHPKVSLDIERNSLAFGVSTVIDSTIRVAGDGNGLLKERVLSLDFNRLILGMGDYEISNAEPFTLRHGADGFAVDTLLLTNDAEEALVAGHFDPAGESDMKVSVSGFLLSHVNDLLKGTADAGALQRYAGIVHAHGSFRGTFRQPHYELDLQAEGVRARNTVWTSEGMQEHDIIIGRLDGRMEYADRMLNLYLQLRQNLRDTAVVPDLLLTGSLPYDLSLEGKRSTALDGEIDVTLRSRGLSMDLLDPFVPEITGLSGTLVCDMRMRGPIGDPRYEGSMSIRNANFLFRPVELRYALNADLIAAGDRIELQNTVIQHLENDGRREGAMNVAGNFRMTGIRFRDFDLLANGQLLVMNSETRRPGQSFFGRLIVASGVRGLKWTGNLQASSLKGDLLVREASLIFPPETEPTELQTGRIAPTYVDDTSQVVVVPVTDEPRRLRLTSRATASNGSGNGRSQEEERGFVDRINYDIALETQGTTQLRMVFNTRTNEELFADLRGRLYFFRTPEVARLTGTVDVSSRSYYNLIKRFNVSEGKLLYTGDPLNPELDITATYEGDHIVRDSVNNPLAQNKVEKVVVTLTITGTKNEPKPKMTLMVDEKKRDTGEEESDAISFILSGQFRDELTDQQRSGLIGTNLGLGLASGMLTGSLSDLIRRNIGVIQSVDVLYYGGESFQQSADVRVTGQIGEAMIRAGGRVLNDPTNLNVSLELPISSVTGSEKLRNLIFTLERRVEGVENTDERRRFSNGARLFYRFSF